MFYHKATMAKQIREANKTTTKFATLQNDSKPALMDAMLNMQFKGYGVHLKPRAMSDNAKGRVRA